MDTTRLEMLGVNRNEAKIYLALLELGQAQAGAISKRTQINRTTVYDAIERLLEKGLVTYVIEANKKIFRPVPPERLVEKIQEQGKLAQELLPELDKIHKGSKIQEESTIYRGRKGIRSVLQEILKYKEYVSFGSSGEFLEIMQHDFKQFQKRKKELGIKSRVLLPEKLQFKEIATSSYAQRRYIPDKYAAPATTWAYGDKVAIVMWTENPVATVIQSKQIAQSYKAYFELLWKTAKT